jgi:hypothetical protein
LEILIILPERRKSIPLKEVENGTGGNFGEYGREKDQ